MLSIGLEPTSMGDDKEELIGDYENKGCTEKRIVVEEESKPEPQQTAFESALEDVGFGRFHIFLSLICGLCLTSCSIQLQCISFVLPSACDMALSSSDKGWLSSIIFLGMMTGAYAFGNLGDVIGRKVIIVAMSLWSGISCLVSSFQQNLILFIFFRFLTGTGVGPCLPVLFTYFSEFFTMKRKGPMLSFLAFFWVFGNIVVSGLAWLVIPSEDLTFKIGNYYMFASWRLFLVLCSIPNISAALLFLFLPESPKFLYQKGNIEKAVLILEKMYKANKRSKLERSAQTQKFLILQNVADIQFSNDGQEEPSKVRKNCLLTFKTTFKQVIHATAEMFNPEYRLRTIILCTVWFTFSFGFFGLFLWLPQFFNNLQDGISTCGRNLSLNRTHSGIFHSNLTCEQSQNNNIYYETFVVSAACIPSTILVVVFINRLKPKFIQAGSMVLSSCCVFFIWFLGTSMDVLILSAVFNFISTCGWNTLNVLSTGLYPTHLRSGAFSTHSIIGRLGALAGNITLGLLVDVHCAIPLLLISALLLCGGLLSLKLPPLTVNL